MVLKTKKYKGKNITVCSDTGNKFAEFTSSKNAREYAKLVNGNVKSKYRKSKGSTNTSSIYYLVYDF